MSKKIDQPGAYRGVLIETALRTTRAAGNPMFVATMRADERYIEDKDQLAFYVEQGVITEPEPQWIDWTEYDETIRTNMVLFSPVTAGDPFIDDENDPDCNATFNYRQIEEALDWDGASFAELANDFLDAPVQFRVGENKPEDVDQYGPVQVKRLAAFDAPPQRELTSVDADTLNALTARLTKKKRAPKKAAAAAPKPSPAGSASSGVPSASPAKAKPKAKATPKATTPPAATAPKTTPSNDEVDSCDKDTAWNESYAAGVTCGAEESEISDTWQTNIVEVADNTEVDEFDFTNVHWAKVRKLMFRTFQQG
jgi:hypothetical protein